MSVTNSKVAQCFEKIVPYFQICSKQVLGNELSWADAENEAAFCCKQSQLNDCWASMTKGQCADDVLSSVKNSTELAAMQRICRSFVSNDSRCQNKLSPATLIFTVFIIIFIAVSLIGCAYQLYTRYRRAKVNPRPIRRQSFNLQNYEEFANYFGVIQPSPTPISSLPTTSRQSIVETKTKQGQSDFYEMLCSQLRSIQVTGNASDVESKMDAIRRTFTEVWVKTQNHKIAPDLDSPSTAVFYLPQEESDSASLPEVVITDDINFVGAFLKNGW